MKKAIILSIFLLMTALIPAISTITTAQENGEDGPTVHSSIRIQGLDDLNETNGVISGTGMVQDPFLIKGLIFNCTLSEGISISNISYHVLISSCVFYGSIYQAEAGISIQNSSHITITDCYSVYSLYAVRAVNSSSIHIANDVFLGSEKGIDLVNTSSSTILNTISSNNLISGVWLENCRNIVVNGYLTEHNNAILGGSNGLSSIDSTNVQIQNSTFDLCYGSGIMILSDVTSSEINIQGSSFDNNNNGILSDGDVVLKVLDCTLTENSHSIYLSRSGSSIISGCVLSRSDYGSYLTDVSNAEIFENHFNYNDRDLVLDGSSYCSIRNNIMNNTRELSLDIGTYSSIDTSRKNVIVKNHFLGDTPFFGYARDKGQSTIWSMDGRGNLWYDGGMPDENGDGIRDIPYDINGNGSVMDPHPIAHELVPVEEPITDTSEDRETDLQLLMASMAVSVLIIMIAAAFYRVSDP